MARKLGDLIFATDEFWNFKNTPLIYLGYARGDIPAIADGRLIHFFYGKENRRIAIREKVLERMETKNDTKV